MRFQLTPFWPLLAPWEASPAHAKEPGFDFYVLPGECKALVASTKWASGIKATEADAFFWACNKSCKKEVASWHPRKRSFRRQPTSRRSRCESSSMGPESSPGAARSQPTGSMSTE